jgi:palmitoyltransferase ZDHHC9/14/18
MVSSAFSNSEQCYYLMSFDNKMIIDATRGTIARFVNHSCEPNCEMIKWTVGGEPRMALFAGPRGIMTGEELTYDYNFEYVSCPRPPSKRVHANLRSPFSQKNIQQCRCGTESCRGVLGPKPKKPVEDKSLASTIIAGTKRKLHDMVESVLAKSENPQMSPKKRKIHSGNPATAKTTNANVHNQVARERAEREATEHDRQIESRQSRALNRSIPSATARNTQTKLFQRRLPSIKSTRVTTVSFQHKVSRSSALKTVKRPARLRTTARQLHPAVGKKRLQNYTPRTPTRSVRGSSAGSDVTDSPNITPASLRSASKRMRPTSTSANSHSANANGDEHDDSRSRTLRRSAKSSSNVGTQAHTAAVNWDYDTDHDVVALNQTTQSKSRGTSGR